MKTLRDYINLVESIGAVVNQDPSSEEEIIPKGQWAQLTPEQQSQIKAMIRQKMDQALSAFNAERGSQPTDEDLTQETRDDDKSNPRFARYFGNHS